MAHEYTLTVRFIVDSDGSVMTVGTCVDDGKDLESKSRDVAQAAAILAEAAMQAYVDQSAAEDRDDRASLMGDR